jgi:outer membrane protein OmpA-like peptidoglycan-associated protein
MLLLSLALAQDLPNIDTQLVRPSADSTTTLWTDDATVTVGPRFRYVQSYANSTLRYADGHGEIAPVLEHLVVGDVLATWGLGPVRGTVGIPVSNGTIILGQRELGIGDVHAELKYSVLDGPLGLAVLGRASAPTANAPLMGAGGISYGGWLVATADMGPARALVNVGSVGVPTSDIGGLVWDDHLSWRAAAAMPIGPGGVALEWGGSVLYSQFDQAAGRPVEAMVTGWYRIGPTRFVVRAGVGVGVNQGLGASRGRGMLGIGYEPTGYEDRDRDGIVDTLDRCASVPEDMDGVEDDDGCPDATSISLVVTDAEGEVLPFEANLNGRDFEGGHIDADAGRYTLTVTASGYDPLVAGFEVPPGQPLEHRVALGAAIGLLRVSVVDPEGEPLDASLVVVDVTTGLADLGEGEMDVPSGDHVLVIETDEYFPARVEFSMDPGGLRHLEVQLEPVIAAMSADRIEVNQTVLFETGSADILEASDDLLGQVADLMLIYPDIRIRIEGHTDDVGDEESNRVLSQERAESVAAYLISMHVPEERLEAVGFGESRPLVEETTPDARAQNRRVEFVFIEAE